MRLCRGFSGGQSTDKLLNKVPELLDCSTEYEQLSLF